MGWTSGAVRVRVPATSANLGPGFDALGLALTLHDEVEARICSSGLSVEISGEGAGLAESGEEHLVVRAMRAAFAITGGQPPGIALRCVNQIPHGRGLGSSAAAIVAGVLAARALSEHGPDKLSDDALLGLASGIEGHPDNVAACLAGGLTIAWMARGHLYLARLDPLASITPVVCVAPAPVQTDVARGLLPRTVPHQDAAANAGRSALLVAALTQHATGWAEEAGSAGEAGPASVPVARGDASAGRASVLLDATEDLLHQDYRASAMPETGDLVRRLRAAGLPAVVSGAGPSVLVFLGAGGEPDYRHHLDSVGSIVRETGNPWRISSLDVERQGARVLRSAPPQGC
jgi:homoserine kinase